MSSVLASSSGKAKAKANPYSSSSSSSSSDDAGSSYLYSSSEDEETPLESQEKEHSSQSKKSHKKDLCPSSYSKPHPSSLSHQTPVPVSQIKKGKFDKGTKKQHKRSKSSKEYEPAKIVDKHKEKKKSKSSKGPVHSSSKSSQKNKEKSANGGSLADKKMAELMAIIAEAGKDVREICEN